MSTKIIIYDLLTNEVTYLDSAKDLCEYCTSYYLVMSNLSRGRLMHLLPWDYRVSACFKYIHIDI